MEREVKIKIGDNKSIVLSASGASTAVRFHVEDDMSNNSPLLTHSELRKAAGVLRMAADRMEEVYGD